MVVAAEDSGWDPGMGRRLRADVSGGFLLGRKGKSCLCSKLAQSCCSSIVLAGPKTWGCVAGGDPGDVAAASHQNNSLL